MVVPTMVPVVHRQEVAAPLLASQALVGASPLLLGHRLRLPAEAGMSARPGGLAASSIVPMRKVFFRGIDLPVFP